MQNIQTRIVSFKRKWLFLLFILIIAILLISRQFYLLQQERVQSMHIHATIQALNATTQAINATTQAINATTQAINATTQAAQDKGDWYKMLAQDEENPNWYAIDSSEGKTTTYTHVVPWLNKSIARPDYTVKYGSMLAF